MSKVLAIETSCDETAVAILEGAGTLENATFTVLGNALYSQIAKHAEFGGVYPSLAKREHQENLSPLATEALKDAGMLRSRESETTIQNEILENLRDEPFQNSVRTFLETYEKPEIDFIAVTRGPGLEPALWTGITFAEALGKVWNIPVIGLDHMEGHIVSALLKPNGENKWQLMSPQTPLLSLLISGGHTELTLMTDWFTYELVGQTKDDAVGEAFDKVARLLDMSYPGGPQIAAFADRARERGDENSFVFPRPMAHDDTCDFSFSGLKTAVMYKLRELDKISEQDKESIAQAFEDAARDVIIIKTERAIQKTGPKTLAIGGGVSANDAIRNGISKMIKDEHPNVTLLFPEKSLTGDNAIMIGAAGYLRHISGKSSSNIQAEGNLRLHD